MGKWPFRRHEEPRTTSPPMDTETTDTDITVSSEAQEALHLAQQAQKNVQAKRAQLAPLMQQIRQHLAENEIASTVSATFVRRSA